MDYSSPCGLLYSPAHSLHAVLCKQRSSRRPLPLPCLLTLPGIRSLSKLPCLRMHIVSFRQLHDLSPWPQFHGTPGEDVRLDPHLHLPLSNLPDDLAPDLVGPLPPSVGLQLPFAPTAWSYGHHQPHGLRPTQKLVLGKHRMFSFLPPSSLGGKYCNSLP